MASKLKVSLSHYSKLEGNFVKPSFDVLSRFKQVFPKVDMNNFFKKEKA
ncbi:MAG: XRE family transcriptional regulator [Lactobacillus sp.]|nr:XRE family transcriptional regulator [Lactobacillus sp.]